jgi:hypothetical protein
MLGTGQSERRRKGVKGKTTPANPAAETPEPESMAPTAADVDATDAPTERAEPHSTVLVGLPVRLPPNPDVYVSRHVEVRLDRRQATALRRVFDGLNANHARLASGRHVDSAADVVRSILERIADDLDSSGGPYAIRPPETPGKT